MRKLPLAALALLGLSLAALAANFPYIRLNQKTNVLSDNGAALTFNGAPIGGGSSLWSDFTTFIALTCYTNSFRVSTNGTITAVDSRGGSDARFSASLDGTASDPTSTLRLSVTDGVNDSSVVWNVEPLFNGSYLDWSINSSLVMELYPGVADGASAIAYKLWTATDLTNATAKITSFGTTSEKAYIDKDGGYHTSDGRSLLWTDFTTFIAPTGFTNAFKLWSGDNAGITLGSNTPAIFPGQTLLSYRELTNGEADYNEISIAVVTNQIPVSAFDTYGSSTYWVTLQQVGAGSYFEHNQLSGTDAYFCYHQGGADRFKLWPTVLDDASAVAYKLWTSTALTNATAKIASFGTTSEKAAVYADGSLSTAANTNRLSWTGVATNVITASVTNSIVMTIDGRKVYVLIANETPP